MAVDTLALLSQGLLTTPDGGMDYGLVIETEHVNIEDAVVDDED